MLLDVHGLDHCTVDADRNVAVVGPGKGGSVLAGELDAQGLFFPAGHCKGVCIGGYLLQGGYGWNSRVFGPACESVIGLDVVTADGEQLYCDADNHPDLYWAARGAGPGFFAVVTAFHLKLYAKPAVCASSLYVYPIRLHRRDLHLGPGDQRRGGPPGGAADRRVTQRAERRDRPSRNRFRVTGVRRLRAGSREGAGVTRHLPGHR